MIARIASRWVTSAALVTIFASAGCKREENPTATEPAAADVTIVAQGELVKGKMWDAPPTAQVRTYAIFYGGHITIYSNDLVIITDPKGEKHAAPLEWCSELVFK